MPRYALDSDTRSNLYALPDELKNEFITAVRDKRLTAKRAGRHYKGDWSDAAQDLVEELIRGGDIDEKYPDRAVYVREIVKTLGRQHSLKIPRHWAGNDGKAVSQDTPGAQLVRSYIKCKRKPVEDDDTFNNRKGFFKRALRRALAHDTVTAMKGFLNSKVAEGGYEFVRKHYRISASHEGDRPPELPGALEKDRHLVGIVKARRREIIDERRHARDELRRTEPTVDRELNSRIGQNLVDFAEQFNAGTFSSLFNRGEDSSFPRFPLSRAEENTPINQLPSTTAPTMENIVEEDVPPMPVATPTGDNLAADTTFTNAMVTNHLVPTTIPLLTPQPTVNENFDRSITHLGPFHPLMRGQLPKQSLRRNFNSPFSTNLPQTTPAVEFSTPIISTNNLSPLARARRMNPEDAPIPRRNFSRPPQKDLPQAPPVEALDEVRLPPKPIPIAIAHPLETTNAFGRINRPTRLPRARIRKSAPIRRNTPLEVEFEFSSNPQQPTVSVSKVKTTPKKIKTKRKKVKHRPKTIRPIMATKKMRKRLRLLPAPPKTKRVPRKVRRSKKSMEPLIMSDSMNVILNPNVSDVQYPQLHHRFVHEKLQQINEIGGNNEVVKTLMSNMNSFLKNKNLFELAKFQNKWGDDFRQGRRE